MSGIFYIFAVVLIVNRTYMSLNTLLIYYLIAINVVTFVVYGIDKLKARRGKWRISEASLLTLAALGGSLGAWAGMSVWRHKTKHKKFTLGVPAIFFLQLLLLIFI